MGTKGLIRLLIALVIAAAVALIAKFTGSGGSGVDHVESQSTTKRKFVIKEFPATEVETIQIRAIDELTDDEKKEGKDDKLELNLKKIDGKWAVAERENFPADQQKVVGLLNQIFSLKIIQPITAGKSQFSRLQLLDPTAIEGEKNLDEIATALIFSNAEGTEIERLLLGKITTREESSQFGTMNRSIGRYVKTGARNVVYLVDEPFESIKTDPSSWTTSDFFKVERIKSIAIDTGNPAEDWKISRADLPDEMTLADAKDGEELDPGKIAGLKSAFGYNSFRDIYVGQEKPKTDTLKFTVTTLDDWTYVISLGEEDDSEGAAVRPLRFTVDAKIQQKRVPEPEEDTGQSGYLDEQFAKRKAKFEKKLTQEKRLSEGRVYKIAASTVSSFIKKRGDLLKPPPEPEKPPGVELPGADNPEIGIPADSPADKPADPSTDN